MAKATRKTKVVLTLTQEEAEVLASILGNVVGEGTGATYAYAIYAALDDEGVLDPYEVTATEHGSILVED